MPINIRGWGKPQPSPTGLHQDLTATEIVQDPAHHPGGMCIAQGQGFDFRIQKRVLVKRENDLAFEIDLL